MGLETADAPWSAPARTEAGDSCKIAAATDSAVADGAKRQSRSYSAKAGKCEDACNEETLE
jgi:hypothetical protein